MVVYSTFNCGPFISVCAALSRQITNFNNDEKINPFLFIYTVFNVAIVTADVILNTLFLTFAFFFLNSSCKV